MKTDVVRITTVMMDELLKFIVDYGGGIAHQLHNISLVNDKDPDKIIRLSLREVDDNKGIVFDVFERYKEDSDDDWICIWSELCLYEDFDREDRERRERLMPNGIPRYIRIYDKPDTFDRYTVVFTGRYRKNPQEDFIHVGLSAQPYSPLGFYQHGYADHIIDRPAYSHLGKKIEWNDLPEDCQKAVIYTYKDIWNIK